MDMTVWDKTVQEKELVSTQSDKCKKTGVSTHGH